MNTTKAEIVLSLALNQLSNNSHLPANAPNRFSVVYNGKSYTAVDDLLNALAANDHSITVYVTWRAVDFFGWLTKDSQGQWKEVPVPVMMDSGVYDSNNNQAILPAIHDEIVIEIKYNNSLSLSLSLSVHTNIIPIGVDQIARDLNSMVTCCGMR